MNNPLQIERFTVGPFAENCYLLVGPSGRSAALVDPGPGSESLLQLLERRGLRLLWVLNTHGHVDHVACNRFFVEKTGAKLAMHAADVDLATRAGRQLQALQTAGFAVDLAAADSPPPDALLDEARPFEFDDLRLEILHTPGHSAGSVCIGHGPIWLVGDTLFRGSVGRTDLPGGSSAQLIASIREKLFRLPRETVCHPGHGPETTVELERRTNPFVSDQATGAFP